MSYRVIQGSAHHIPELADRSVHVICCSPPYFGLRAYSGDQGIEWPTMEYSPMPGLPPLRIQGCEPGCVHEWVDGKTIRQSGGKNNRTLTGGADWQNQTHFTTTQGAYCIHCGGWRGALGLEPSPAAYVGHLILCLRAWHRILRDDGTCWVNLGDSYAGSGGAHADHHKNKGISQSAERDGAYHHMPRGSIPAKNLIGVPWRFAFAAQADGWYLRSAMPWIKRNGMPESVTDRPAQVVESIFLLTKSEDYYFDMQAVSQPTAQPERIGKIEQAFSTSNGDITGRGDIGRSVERTATRNFRSSDLFFKTWQGLLTSDDGDPLAMVVNPVGFSGAHFACFPELVPEIAIKAGSSQYGCCAKCQAPWERTTEHTDQIDESAKGSRFDKGKTAVNGNGRTQEGERYVKVSTGWAPACQCACDDVTPCTVLDPFLGSGTTARVALALGRNAIGVDMSQAYLTDLVPKRASNVQMQLAL